MDDVEILKIFFAVLTGQILGNRGSGKAMGSHKVNHKIHKSALVATMSMLQVHFSFRSKGSSEILIVECCT